MQIRKSDDLWVVKKRNGTVLSNLSGHWTVETEQEKIDLALHSLSIAKSDLTDEEKSKIYDDDIKKYRALMPSEEELKHIEEQNAIKKAVAESLINFFKDFEFEPSFRFTNTLYWHCNSLSEAQTYVSNYFSLSDNQYKNDVVEKMKSYEFSNIINKMKKIETSNKINDRLKIYYGSAGTGKTTQTMNEADNNVVVCNSAMLPSDLLEDFAFDNGKAGFHKSALWIAMEEGKTIVFDEINLLPFESVRFLQGITDNKSSIIYKGQTINIKKGFNIIGTMNLMLNGSCYGLPEPLLDRASDLRQYTLTAEQLAYAF